MDPLYSKAQRQVSGKSKTSATSSKASSKRSKKKKQSPKTQTAGQPSGTSARVASRRAPRQIDRSVEPSGDGDAGVGKKWSLRTMGLLHVVDAGLGLSCIIYGAIVHVAGVTAACVGYGLVLTLGSLCGGVGYWAKTGKRRGLQASSIAGLFAAFLDVAGFVFTLVSWDSFIAFVEDNAGDLLLNDSSIGTIESLKIILAAVFFALACIEVFRFFTMRRMRQQIMQQQDNIPRSGISQPSKYEGWLSWFGLGNSKRTDDFVMFDDDTSLRSALLWSKNGSQPSSEDYLEFLPDHEISLANYTSGVALPAPPADRTDY
mmetsp:Transcript_31575/g.65411  ORF Transcript_31575/g.65411 Transcript_31575/m.65411 type:complete len:317 (+) Transcript_31575:234-1184(+)